MFCIGINQPWRPLPLIILYIIAFDMRCIWKTIIKAIWYDVDVLFWKLSDTWRWVNFVQIILKSFILDLVDIFSWNCKLIPRVFHLKLTLSNFLLWKQVVKIILTDLNIQNWTYCQYFVYFTLITLDNFIAIKFDQI